MREGVYAWRARSHRPDTRSAPPLVDSPHEPDNTGNRSLTLALQLLALVALVLGVKRFSISRSAAGVLVVVVALPVLAASVVYGDYGTPREFAEDNSCGGVPAQPAGSEKLDRP